MLNRVILWGIGSLLAWGLSVMQPLPAQAAKVMPALAFDAPGETVEVAAVYETAYATQKSVIKSLKVSSKAMKKAPGFKGAAVLQSQDGKQVMVVSQWQDLASYQAYTPAASTAEASKAEEVAAPPAPTQVSTYTVVATQPAIAGSTAALRGKEAVVQWVEFAANTLDSRSQVLAQVQTMTNSLLQPQPIPQSIVLLQTTDSGSIALVRNWNCSALFEDVGKPTAIAPSPALAAIATTDQHLYNVINIIPAPVKKAPKDSPVAST
jgi:heme-degrading monooxygenase HmoA